MCIQECGITQSSITRAVYGSGLALPEPSPLTSEEVLLGCGGDVQSITIFSSSGEKRRKKGAPGRSPESNRGMLRRRRQSVRE